MQLQLRRSTFALLSVCAPNALIIISPYVLALFAIGGRVAQQQRLQR
jgi:hypothetical protein